MADEGRFRRYEPSLRLGGEICKALGIDPTLVAAMRIVLDPAEIATVELRMFLPAPATTSFVERVRRYRLVEIDERLATDPGPIARSGVSP